MDRGLPIFLALAVVTTGFVAAILSRPPSRGCAPPVAEPDWLSDVSGPEAEGGRPEAAAPEARIRAAAPAGSSVTGSSARPQQSSDSHQAAQPPGLARSYPRPHWISAWAEPLVGRGVADPWGNSAPTTHTVEDGDTLPGLAARYLGDAARWPEIFEANRDVLADPEALPVGIRLRLPSPSQPASRTRRVLERPLVPVTPQIPEGTAASSTDAGTQPGHLPPRWPDAAAHVLP